MEAIRRELGGTSDVPELGDRSIRTKRKVAGEACDFCMVGQHEKSTTRYIQGDEVVADPATVVIGNQLQATGVEPTIFVMQNDAVWCKVMHFGEAMFATLSEALSELPRGPRRIFRYLKNISLAGERKNGCRCVIANFLRMKMGVLDVEVDYAYIFAGGQTVDPPADVLAFIKRFDDGGFPELDLETVKEQG